ncbi:peptidase domain-containing ABC transporter [Methylobacterium oxalidis]|uniref:peptidase domain-containing ABC transporter n=1 Tax=Methylobacterium oxalidis TaxID=944322 RepID=UPI00331600DA
MPDARTAPLENSASSDALPDRSTVDAQLALRSRLQAVITVALHHGVELDARDFRLSSDQAVPSPASLALWVQSSGLWAKAARVRWRQLLRLEESAPVILLLTNGTAALLAGWDREKGVVLVANPLSPDAPPLEVAELRLKKFWHGDVLLIRRERRATLDEAQFSFTWLMKLVLHERRNLREILAASLTLSVLQILPPFLIMAAIDRVMTHHTLSTLSLITLMLVIVTGYEALLSFARREIVEVMSTRLDARINVHVFRRLLALPIEFFERTPTGETTHKVSQIFKIRDFLTGKLVNTVLDVFTLVILLPFLFWMSATLAWLVLAASTCVGLTVLCFLPAIRHVYAQLIVAEVKKGSVLVETVHGMRTVKSLAIEDVRKQEWDERVAESGHARLAAGRIANWAQTITLPLERFVDRGVLLCGAYILLMSPAGSTGITAGSLIAFMMLGARVASPLIGFAKLTQDIEEVRTSISQVSEVLNNPTETAAMRGGLRPKFQGQIVFEEVSFRYPGSQALALNGVNFSIPAGTMLGLVGRSGSGKSTIARLLQGINRDYSGRLKIDGSDLREINLTHLRRSFGVVMQDNFLFRGTVRENIIAGRSGLTLDDVVRAARMAGAEEFIERLPRGYETWIEEGSANLSGGQRQRLAIARALIVDPRLLILDEATSALDPESEALVNANLLRIAKGRTMVIVSHRLSSLVDCDQILVLDKGRAVDIGPHGDLLERCSIYRQLWQQQNKHAERGRQTQLKSIAAGE